MHPIAHEDTSLVARVVGRTPLLYTAGPDPALDRPAHVRAGSGLARIGGRIAVVQDDANFIAIVDPEVSTVDAVTLPPGADGLRQFDDLRGNKDLKLDLEACASVPGDRLVAFASGSKSVRRWIVMMSVQAEGGYATTMHDAASLYDLLRSRREFAGSDMNIEGALFIDGMVRLFTRGNGTSREGFEPIDATCDLEWDALERYLLSGCTLPPPEPMHILRYDLGGIDGIRLGFTDAESAGGKIYFAASAENSPDATLDGEVTGSAIGIFDSDSELRWTTIVDAEGKRFHGKIEGLLIEPDGAWGVIDGDDPRVPTELCRLQLSGPWL